MSLFKLIGALGRMVLDNRFFLNDPRCSYFYLQSCYF